ncbi:MAG: DUF4404 family protein [Gammaproteobacteria bacterium]
MNPTASNKDRLAELLAELERELDHADSLDDVGRQRMRDVQAALSRALDTRGRDAPEDLAGLADPVQRSIDEFEKTHPRLTLTLGRILDALNKIGV